MHSYSKKIRYVSIACQEEIQNVALFKMILSVSFENMKWYEKAKILMKQKGITQDDLIPVFGVKTRGAVGHYLTGRRQPDPDQLAALAHKLGCMIDDLFCKESETSQKDINDAHKGKYNVPEKPEHQTSQNIDISKLIPVASPATQELIKTLEHGLQEGRLDEEFITILNHLSQKAMDDKNRKNR
jgi:transcriptional regulator with XRE-family HTH domain